MTETAETAPLPSLDRDRTYGEVHGEQRPSVERHDGVVHAMYEQDSFLFDAFGQMIPELLSDAGKAKLAQRIAREKAVGEARATFQKVMAGTGMTSEQIAKVVNLDNLEAPIPAEIDLRKWALGEQGQGEKVQVAFGTIAKLIREKYNQAPTNKKQAIDILAEHHVIAFGSGSDATHPSMT